MKNIIARGAEAILYKENDKLVKERIKKNYRLEALDKEIRKSRTRKEAKLLQKVDFSPKVFDVDEKEMKITMDFIDGKLVKDILDNLKKDEREKICEEIGENVAKLHNSDIIHGDLTTSNFIFNKKVYFIDFGLGFVSKKIEDKAVDLHLLRQALESKHYIHVKKCFEDVLEGYKRISNSYNEIIKRLEKVEQRGRYKQKAK